MGQNNFQLRACVCMSVCVRASSVNKRSRVISTRLETLRLIITTLNSPPRGARMPPCWFVVAQRPLEFRERQHNDIIAVTIYAVEAEEHAPAQRHLTASTLLTMTEAARGSSSSTAPAPPPISVEQALSQPVEEIPVNGGGPNGSTNNDHDNDAAADDDAGKSKAALIDELQLARSDRDAFESQYKSLLGKLSLMRSTLGDRLRQDAEELDRRESQIESLNAQVADLTAGMATLREELLASNAENERVTGELDEARRQAAAAAQASATDDADTPSTAAATNEAHASALASLRTQLTAAHSSAEHERSAREEVEERLRALETTSATLRDDATHWQSAAEAAQQSARNLQSVLEEFQADQEAELDGAVGEYRHRYECAREELASWQSRAKSAEESYAVVKDAAARAQHLEQETREKNLLIGKLRHEAVILNEHLTEALRRLQRHASDVNVDRRLVTNVLLQFLTTPRQDAKRFEMLALIGEVLQWGDEERRVAGLKAGSSGSGQGRSAAAGIASSPSSAKGTASSVGGQDEVSERAAR